MKLLLRLLKFFSIAVFFLFLLLGAVFYIPLINTQIQTEIPLHSNTAQACTILTRENVIPHYWICRGIIGLLSAEQQLKPGVYVFEAHDTGYRIIDRMVRGESLPVKFTVIEGERLKQVLDDLNDQRGIVPVNLETLKERYPTGSLLADTYFYRYGVSADRVLRQAKSSLDKELKTFWNKRSADLPYKTPSEAIVVASMIEKETALTDEKKLVSGVIINRLRKGMHLQIDATVNFALNEYRRLSNKDYAINHPFNTYKKKGLPPAPICNVSRSSLFAALHPSKTLDLFYVAKGDGSHSFASTYSKHLANIKQAHKKLESK